MPPPIPAVKRIIPLVLYEPESKPSFEVAITKRDGKVEGEHVKECHFNKTAHPCHHKSAHPTLPRITHASPCTCFVVGQTQRPSRASITVLHQVGFDCLDCIETAQELAAKAHAEKEISTASISVDKTEISSAFARLIIPIPKAMSDQRRSKVLAEEANKNEDARIAQVATSDKIAADMEHYARHILGPDIVDEDTDREIQRDVRRKKIEEMKECDKRVQARKAEREKEFTASAIKEFAEVHKSIAECNRVKRMLDFDTSQICMKDGYSTAESSSDSTTTNVAVAATKGYKEIIFAGSPVSFEDKTITLQVRKPIQRSLFVKVKPSSVKTETKGTTPSNSVNGGQLTDSSVQEVSHKFSSRVTHKCRNGALYLAKKSPVTEEISGQLSEEQTSENLEARRQLKATSDFLSDNPDDKASSAFAQVKLFPGGHSSASTSVNPPLETQVNTTAIGDPRGRADFWTTCHSKEDAKFVNAKYQAEKPAGTVNPVSMTSDTFTTPLNSSTVTALAAAPLHEKLLTPLMANAIRKHSILAASVRTSNTNAASAMFREARITDKDLNFDMLADRHPVDAPYVKAAVELLAAEKKTAEKKAAEKRDAEKTGPEKKASGEKKTGPKALLAREVENEWINLSPNEAAAREFALRHKNAVVKVPEVTKTPEAVKAAVEKATAGANAVGEEWEDLGGEEEESWDFC